MGNNSFQKQAIGFGAFATPSEADRQERIKKRQYEMDFMKMQQGVTFKNPLSLFAFTTSAENKLIEKYKDYDIPDKFTFEEYIELNSFTKQYD